jgi:hypothetical protein
MICFWLVSAFSDGANYIGGYETRDAASRMAYLIRSHHPDVFFYLIKRK